MRVQRRALIAGVALLTGVAIALGYAFWWRKNPSACPYEQHFFLEMPHPFLTRARLRRILAPRPGERVLEVGPGTGYYTLNVAQQLAPDGTLDILDLQQQMLDHTMRRAREHDITNIVPTRGDAVALPYPDDTFDAAYMNFVLGEVPDQEKALRELRRVLKPGGRLVVGEAFPDPHMVTFEKLRARAEAAGLRFERRLGGSLGYYARFSA
jgi:ubiquinone/menaquinone biosynthesis C-methylase UbiE